MQVPRSPGSCLAIHTVDEGVAKARKLVRLCEPLRNYDLRFFFVLQCKEALQALELRQLKPRTH